MARFSCRAGWRSEPRHTGWSRESSSMIRPGSSSSRRAILWEFSRAPSTPFCAADKWKRYKVTVEFQDRVALITGGSRGIGRATALRLAREGADLAVSYVSRAQQAEEVVREIKQLGRRAACFRCNVASPEEVRQLVAQTRQQLGSIDFLVHCGAISNIQDHQHLSYDIWRETIDINLNGAYLAVFAVKNEMIARRFGRIVTLSSIAALRPRQMQIHYASVKAGVIALTRCCAEEFAPHNMRINCVSPGLM